MSRQREPRLTLELRSELPTGLPRWRGTFRISSAGNGGASLPAANPPNGLASETFDFLVGALLSVLAQRKARLLKQAGLFKPLKLPVSAAAMAAAATCVTTAAAAEATASTAATASRTAAAILRRRCLHSHGQHRRHSHGPHHRRLTAPAPPAYPRATPPA